MNHTIYRGDTANFRLEVVDYLGAAVNINGWTFVLSAARKRGGMVAFTSSGAIEDIANGVVNFTLNPAQTTPVGKYFYDVQATTDSSHVYTVATGELNIIQDVTQ